MQLSPRLTEPRRNTNQQPRNKCGCCALYSPRAAGSAEREPPLFLCLGEHGGRQNRRCRMWLQGDHLDRRSAPPSRPPVPRREDARCFGNGRVLPWNNVLANERRKKPPLQTPGSGPISRCPFDPGALSSHVQPGGPCHREDARFPAAGAAGLNQIDPLPNSSVR